MISSRCPRGRRAAARPRSRSERGPNRGGSRPGPPGPRGSSPATGCRPAARWSSAERARPSVRWPRNDRSSGASPRPSIATATAAASSSSPVDGHADHPIAESTDRGSQFGHGRLGDDLLQRRHRRRTVDLAEEAQRDVPLLRGGSSAHPCHQGDPTGRAGPTGSPAAPRRRTAGPSPQASSSRRRRRSSKVMVANCRMRGRSPGSCNCSEVTSSPTASPRCTVPTG